MRRLSGREAKALLRAAIRSRERIADQLKEVLWLDGYRGTLEEFLEYEVGRFVPTYWVFQSKKPPFRIQPATLPEEEKREAASASSIGWVEVTILGPSGETYPGSEIEITVPDGSTRRGLLDDASTFSVQGFTGAGSCRVAVFRVGDPVEWGSRPGVSEKTIRSNGPQVTVSSNARHTLMLVIHGAACVRIKGAMFPLQKTCLLPGALDGTRMVVDMVERSPGAELLVVGHADPSGSTKLNDALSLERANALSAFLRDDVEAWYRYYESSVSSSKPWGGAEDIMMLSALPHGSSQPYYGEHHEDYTLKASVMRFQEDDGLTVDGIAGPITRRALIEAYMAADNTSLPQGVRVVCHGCGESFPTATDATSSPDKKPDPGGGDRRVEVFIFQPSIDPEPSTSISGVEDGLYPVWTSRVEEERTFVVGPDGPGELHLWTDIEAKYADVVGVRFVLESSDGSYASEQVPHVDGEDNEGFMVLTFHDLPCQSAYSLKALYESGTESMLFEDVPYAELYMVSFPPEDSVVDPFEF